MPKGDWNRESYGSSYTKFPFTKIKNGSPVLVHLLVDDFIYFTKHYIPEMDSNKGGYATCPNSQEDGTECSACNIYNEDVKANEEAKDNGEKGIRPRYYPSYSFRYQVYNFDTKRPEVMELTAGGHKELQKQRTAIIRRGKDVADFDFEISREKAKGKDYDEFSAAAFSTEFEEKLDDGTRFDDVLDPKPLTNEQLEECMDGGVFWKTKDSSEAEDVPDTSSRRRPAEEPEKPAARSSRRKPADTKPDTKATTKAKAKPKAKPKGLKDAPKEDVAPKDYPDDPAEKYEAMLDSVYIAERGRYKGKTFREIKADNKNYKSWLTWVAENNPKCSEEAVFLKSVEDAGGIESFGEGVPEAPAADQQKLTKEISKLIAKSDLKTDHDALIGLLANATEGEKDTLGDLDVQELVHLKELITAHLEG